MFHDFYQMLEEPFGVSPDPRFLYLGASHREALASLFYGIESGRGLMVLIASPGCGKTTLIHQLVGKIKPGARTVFLFQTQCTSNEMLQYLLNDLGVDIHGMERVAMHNRLQQILTQEKLAGRRFVLIVDEAQNLEPSVLETIRLLSNFETSQQKLLQILLVGQPQLARKLASPGHDQLQQRISICAKLQPFNAEETAGYIAHRLKVAGYSGGALFTPGAMNLITDRSQGLPRNINRLCFGALSLGYAMGRNQVDAEMMREVAADLDGERPEGSVGNASVIAPGAGKPVAQNASGGRSNVSKRPQARKVLGWAVTGVAASLLIAFGWLQYSRSRTGQPLQAKTAMGTPVMKSLPAGSQDSSPVTAPAPPVVQRDSAPGVVAPAPKAVTRPKEPSGDEAATADTGTVKVVVRPGETLQRIALRTLGQDNSRLIRQIQDLNPRLKNPDHIEADQEIRLPQVQPELPSVPQ